MNGADVAIIGCGPAGLLSAYAVTRGGGSVDIYSDRPEPSPMARGVYLHEAIPDLTSPNPDGHIVFRKVGTEEGYATKVYGYPVRRTSWSRFDEGLHAAWALAPAYHALWERYRDRVRRLRATPEVARELADAYTLVINTAPAHVICEGGQHVFESSPIWLVSAAPPFVQPNSVIYSGLDTHPWYRAQDLFGWRVTEFARKPPGTPSREGFKVVSTNCDCHPGIMRNGRYGMWTPGILLHAAFKRAEVMVSGVR
jgi:cation diffusion facilitator CzcD-associated flavoprotein CzcO